MKKPILYIVIALMLLFVIYVRDITQTQRLELKIMDVRIKTLKDTERILLMIKDSKVFISKNQDHLLANLKLINSILKKQDQVVELIARQHLKGDIQ